MGQDQSHLTGKPQQMNKNRIFDYSWVKIKAVLQVSHNRRIRREFVTTTDGSSSKPSYR